MQYIQKRSFIATLTSVTPGYEGVLDSVEVGSPSRRKNAWLTVASPYHVVTQQRFWFGYFDGKKAGYQVRTVESDSGDSHYSIWGLSTNNYVGYYVKSTNPVLWGVRVDGAKIGEPERRVYEDVTLEAPSKELLGVRTRKSWEDHYVEVDAPNKLLMRMDVMEVNVALFDQYSKFLRR